MRSPTAVAALVVCGLASRASVSPAQTPPMMPERWPEAAAPVASPPAAPPETRWYGWQTLALDIGVFTLTPVLGARVDERSKAEVISFAVFTGTSFLLGGPIIHAAHGHHAKAVGSLALRLALVIVGGAIGFGIGEGDESCGGQTFCDREGYQAADAAAGLIAGAVAAMIVDAAVLGREQVPPRARPASSVGFLPLRGGGGLSITGQF